MYLDMDPELQAIREARLAQLKSNGGGANGDRSSGGNNGGGDDSAPVGASIANFLEPQASFFFFSHAQQYVQQRIKFLGTRNTI